ncbi:hypothetical protein [Haladaptatus caseinilyticus]|uniref:hypothetical protein n=1 Tax=Haladaptatus caseinilyticus TaxID=2993314 RepID=UPI00224AE4DF|nr:hypothetical protein [Haladaptatus caseinilyticus]
MKSRLGLRRWFVSIPPPLGALLALLWFVPIAAIPAFFAVSAVDNVTRPLAGQYVNDLTLSVGRATVLSSASMVYSLVTIPFAVGSGVVADSIGPVRALAVLGGLLAVGSLTLQLWESPVEHERVVTSSD